MKFLSSLLALLLVTAPALAVSSSFARDVARPALRSNSAAASQRKQQRREHDLNEALLAKAKPYAEYKAMLASHGLMVEQQQQPHPLPRSSNHRQLENDNQDDDFYLDDDAMYSFSGFSVRYTQCQPVKYFSEDAVEAGEHSPMLTQDIVVLRLCPQATCSESTSYGCHYNYVEYALSLTEYLNIMLRFSDKKRDALCEWCDDCYNNQRRRRVEEDRDEEENQEEDDRDEEENEEEDRDDENEEQQEEDDKEEEQQDEADNENQDGGDDANGGDDDFYYAGDCENFDTYCSSYKYECNDDGDDGSYNYVDYEKYMDYLECAQADYNGYAFFVRPRCNNYQGTIEMAVYYDNYCSQVSSEHNVKDLGLGLKEGFFADYYSGECIDCSESDYPPNFNYGSALCNNLHATSAKCTNDLNYDLFDGEESDSSECSYIETIRFGTYDQDGEVSSGISAFSGWKMEEVSTLQKIFLSLSIIACVFFIIYSCYLHHAMTNLLIKSLSHRELLPPSRHQNRRRSGPASRRGKRLLADGGEADWQN